MTSETESVGERAMSNDGGLEKPWYTETPKQWFLNCCQNHKWPFPEFRTEAVSLATAAALVGATKSKGGGGSIPSCVSSVTSGGAFVCRIQLPPGAVEMLRIHPGLRAASAWGKAGAPPSGLVRGVGATRREAELSAAIEGCRLLDSAGLLLRRGGHGVSAAAGYHARAPHVPTPRTTAEAEMAVATAAVEQARSSVGSACTCVFAQSCKWPSSGRSSGAERFLLAGGAVPSLNGLWREDAFKVTHPTLALVCSLK